jgi:hypothetical protein
MWRTKPVLAQLALRGLPFEAGVDEICAWLSGLGVDATPANVTLCKTKRRKNGRATVHMGTHLQAMAAAESLHLSKFGHRYVEAYFRATELRTHSSVEDRHFGAWD